MPASGIANGADDEEPNGTAPPPPADEPSDPPAKPRRADKAAPWMGEVRRVWREHYGGEPPAQAVRALRPVVAAFGDGGMLERLTAYCDVTTPRFVDLFRFASTAGTWLVDASVNGSPGGAALTAPIDAEVTRVARALWAGFKATGILRAQTPDQYAAKAAALVASGAVRDLPALRALWQHVDRPRLLDARTDDYAERHLADVVRTLWRDLAAPVPTPAAA